MKASFVIGDRKAELLAEHLGKDRVVIGPYDSDGYARVEFEIRNSMDVLSILHAGQDFGLELGLYGPGYRPKGKVA